MSNPICAALSGNLNGETLQGALTPVPLSYALNMQKAHTQKSVVVLPADAGKVIALDAAATQGEPGNVQTFFMMVTDRKVSFTLNGGGPLYTINANAPFVFGGTPEIISIEFTGADSVNANVYITKIIGAP